MYKHFSNFHKVWRQCPSPLCFLLFSTHYYIRSVIANKKKTKPNYPSMLFKVFCKDTWAFLPANTQDTLIDIVYYGTINMFWHNYFLHEGNVLWVFSPKNWKFAHLKLRSRVLDLATGETLHFFSHRASWLSFSVYLYTEFRFRSLCEVQYLTTWACRKIFRYWSYCIYHLHTEKERKKEERQRLLSSWV